MREMPGIAVSPAVVIGRAFLLDDIRRPVSSRSINSGEVQNEQARLDEAVEASLAELAELRTRAEEEFGRDAAQIFAFHQGMLMDKTLIDPMRQRIADDHVPAETAVQEQFRIVAEQFARMPDTAFRTKVDDVWDLDHRVLRHLIGEHQNRLADSDTDSVVIASELTPTQTASFRDQGVAGFATDSGGLTSHTAIFARALNIPAVVGCESLVDTARDGDPIIIDGDQGLVIVRPDEETLERYEERARVAAALAASLRETANEPAITTDGVEIELLGNIEYAAEVPTVLEYGGRGVGLFRTEYLWLTSDHEPTEEEQYKAFAESVGSADGLPVTIRTFDLGADKYTQQRAMNPERNPFLGERSIRYCLTNISMFKQHLRAVLRASAIGPLKIMFPLISTMMELRQAKLVLHDVMEDLAEEGIAFDPNVKIGMMVETPAAAIMSTSFAREVDFFSVGTNDLIQYTIAVDRTNERVANLYSGADPAVLRLMKDTIRSARRHEVPVSCCGEVAGDPEYTMLLLGLGFRTLSASPSRLPYVKRVVRSVDINACELLARRAGSLDSERQVTALLRDAARKHFPELFDGRSIESGV
ncbi:MAG: phosphoenolpyruvate--protein phosphotransferase [Planctomycetota bacterium]